MAGVSTKNLARSRAPRFAYTTIATAVLPGWDISLVFVGPKKARALNIQLREKDSVPNVLSYALGDRNGEIFICLKGTKGRASARSGKNERERILHLFIHGLLHIRGWAHGVTMEQCEQKLLARYAQKNSNRNRHRHEPDKNGRRRGIQR